jgi:hypothetical protein
VCPSRSQRELSLLYGRSDYLELRMNRYLSCVRSHGQQILSLAFLLLEDSGQLLKSNS